MAPDAVVQQNQTRRQLLVAGIVGAVVGVVFSALAGAGTHAALLLLGTAALVAIWWLAMMLKHRGQDWLVPPVLFLLGVVLYYLLRPASLVLGMAPVGQQSVPHMNTALGLVLFALFGFIWGYKLPVARMIVERLPRAAADWQQQRVHLAIGLTMASGNGLLALPYAT